MDTCPRCGAALPAGLYLDTLATVAGREPAYRLRHRKTNGRMCVAYVGPEVLATLPPHRQGDVTVIPPRAKLRDESEYG